MQWTHFNFKHVAYYVIIGYIRYPNTFMSITFYFWAESLIKLSLRRERHQKRRLLKRLLGQMRNTS